MVETKGAPAGYGGNIPATAAGSVQDAMATWLIATLLDRP